MNYWMLVKDGKPYTDQLFKSQDMARIWFTLNGSGEEDVKLAYVFVAFMQPPKEKKPDEPKRKKATRKAAK